MFKCICIIHKSHCDNQISCDTCRTRCCRLSVLTFIRLQYALTIDLLPESDIECIMKNLSYYFLSRETI